MKKLIYISEESIIAGNAKCGVSDVVDGLSNACSQLYHVCVVTQDHRGYLTQASPSKDIMDGVRAVKLFGSWYYLVDPDDWDNLVVKVVEYLQPDIIHNFASPEILGKLKTAPSMSVYTIDHAKYARGKEEFLNQYDAITTVSKAYAAEILSENDSLSEFLKTKKFVGITNGIMDSVLNPATGFLIDGKFSPISNEGKLICKKSLLNNLNISGNPVVFSAIARLAEEKGIEDIISVAKIIKDNNGVLIVYGRGEPKYESVFADMAKNGLIKYINLAPSLIKAIPVLAGSDFHVSPSLTEPCGLMPMVASRYGAIPITTLAGGLSDNFNNKNAIIIDGDIKKAIEAAFVLTENKTKKDFFSAKVMSQSFSWNVRKDEYIKIYEQQ